MAAFPGNGSTWSTSCGAPSDPLVNDAPTPRRLLYGRRRGRPLRPGQQGLVEHLLPSLAISNGEARILVFGILDELGKPILDAAKAARELVERVSPVHRDFVEKDEIIRGGWSLFGNADG